MNTTMVTIAIIKHLEFITEIMIINFLFFIDFFY